MLLSPSATGVPLPGPKTPSPRARRVSLAPPPSPRVRKESVTKTPSPRPRAVSFSRQNPPSRQTTPQPPQSILVPALDRTDDEDHKLPRRPYPNSYWATPMLLGSEYPTKGTDEMSMQRLEYLVDSGISDFIDLTLPGESLPGEQYLRPLASIATKRGLGLLKMVGTDRVDHHKLGPNASQDPRYKHIATAADWQPAQPKTVLRYGSFPIPDTTCPDNLTIQAILSALYFSNKQGRRAIVHCNGGYGRTGTVVGCWLVFSSFVRDTIETIPNTYTQVQTTKGVQLVQAQRQIPAGQHALEWLAKKWRGVEKSRTAPYTPGNPTQMEYVRSFRPPKNSPTGH